MFNIFLQHLPLLLLLFAHSEKHLVPVLESNNLYACFLSGLHLLILARFQLGCESSYMHMEASNFLLDVFLVCRLSHSLHLVLHHTILMLQFLYFRALVMYQFPQLLRLFLLVLIQLAVLAEKLSATCLGIGETCDIRHLVM